MQFVWCSSGGVKYIQLTRERSYEMYAPLGIARDSLPSSTPDLSVTIAPATFQLKCETKT